MSSAGGASEGEMRSQIAKLTGNDQLFVGLFVLLTQHVYRSFKATKGGFRKTNFYIGQIGCCDGFWTKQTAADARASRRATKRKGRIRRAHSRARRTGFFVVNKWKRFLQCEHGLVLFRSSLWDKKWRN
jgi:hypothetical protein